MARGAPRPADKKEGAARAGVATATLASQTCPPASPWRMRFDDPEVEDDYRDVQADRIVAQARRYAWIAACFGPVAAIVPGPANMQHASVALGLMLSAFGLGGLWVTGQARLKHVTGTIIAALCVAIGLVYVGVAAKAEARVAHDIFILMGAHMVATATALRLRFRQTLPIGLGLLAVFVAAAATRADLAAVAAVQQSFAVFIFTFLGLFACHQMELASRGEFLQQRAVALEKERSEALLRNILPGPIAERLKADSQPIADGFASVTVLFADIVGFTPLSARLSPREVVAMLDRMFSAFDELAERHGLEKIKTIGDAYMAAAGLPEPRDDHAPAAAAMALDMLEVVRQLAAELGEPLDLRIGLNSGPVVAGVIGRRKFIYDLWGDAVNVASRMESHGLVGAVQMTAATRDLLDATFDVEPRGLIEVKGRGQIETFLLRASGSATG